MSATIPDDTITKPAIERDGEDLVVIRVPNFESPSAPMTYVIETNKPWDLIDVLNIAFRMGEIYAHRCIANDIKRGLDTTVQEFDHEHGGAW